MVGISLSVALHVMVILALFAGVAGRDVRGRTIARGPREVMIVSLNEPLAASIPSHRARPTPVMEAHAGTAAKTESPVPALVLAAVAPGSLRMSDASADGTNAPAAEPVPVVDPTLEDDYRRRLLAHIAGYRRSLSGGAGGLTQVRLAIGRDGDVLAVAVASGSGDANLDDEAVATIWRARPMPAIPDALPSRLVVTLPVSFDPKRFAAVPASWP